MDVDSAATFLACSILVSCGVGSIGVVLLALNNIFSKFWKPTGITWWPPYLNHTQYKFVDPDDVGKVKAVDESYKNTKQ